MSSLMGHVDVSFDELVKTFGPPNCENDGYKTDAEWEIETPFGIATIYNYKDGINYNGKSGTPTRRIRDWHIGGDNPQVVGFIHGKLGK